MDFSLTLRYILGESQKIFSYISKLPKEDYEQINKTECCSISPISEAISILNADGETQSIHTVNCAEVREFYWVSN